MFNLPEQAYAFGLCVIQCCKANNKVINNNNKCMWMCVCLLMWVHDLQQSQIVIDRNKMYNYSADKILCHEIYLWCCKTINSEWRHTFFDNNDAIIYGICYMIGMSHNVRQSSYRLRKGSV